MSQTSPEGRSTKGLLFANIFLIGSAGGCFLVLTYFFYYYGWTQQRYFTNQLGILFYYVCPAILFFIFIGLLLLSENIKVNVATGLLSIVITIYTIEILMISIEIGMQHSEEEFRDAKQIARLARTFSVEFDTRNKHEVIADLAKQGIDAYPAITARMLLQPQPDGSMRSAVSINGAEVLPLGGIANTVTILCNENGEYTIYASDERGFHNPWGSGDAGHSDIVAVGDSFTHGACVRSNENFVALIRMRYPKTLNLGATGSGPLLMLAAIKEYGQLFSPKKVLWFYCEENDLDDLGVERKSPLLMRYLGGDFHQGLLGRQGDVDRVLATHVHAIEAAFVDHGEPPRYGGNLVRRIESTLKLYRLRQRFGFAYGDIRPDRIDEEKEATLALFRRVLLVADESVRAWGGTLYFVYLPEWRRYGKPESANRDRDRVLKLVRGLALPLIDVHEAFVAHGDPLGLFPFRRLWHYNPEGYRVVAEAVLKLIASKVATTHGATATVVPGGRGQSSHE